MKPRHNKQTHCYSSILSIFHVETEIELLMLNKDFKPGKKKKNNLKNQICILNMKRSKMFKAWNTRNSTLPNKTRIQVQCSRFKVKSILQNVVLIQLVVRYAKTLTSNLLTDKSFKIEQLLLITIAYSLPL